MPISGLTLQGNHDSFVNFQDPKTSEDTQTTDSDENGSSEESFTSSEEGSLGSHDHPKEVKDRLVAVSGAPTRPWEIILDNGSQVNIVHPRFLVDFKQRPGRFSGLQGESLSTQMCGLLPGFFYCLVSDSTQVSVLSQADVEDTHPVTYNPGVSYTVHMGDRDLVFHRRDKFYVGDFSEWVHEEYQDDEVVLSGMTVAEKEHLYTRKERRKAIYAGRFIKNAGYLLEREAVAMARDGNLKNIPYDAVDIKRHFDIYGPSAAHLQGKMTQRKVSSLNQVDVRLRDKRRDQTLTSNVIHVIGLQFLVSVAQPLELTVTVQVNKMDAKGLGQALTTHVNLLNSHGFKVRRVIVDPQRGFTSIEGVSGGVELDIVGAGDHLNKVDARICRLKELMRCVVAGLPYALPKARCSDLVS